MDSRQRFAQNLRKTGRINPKKMIAIIAVSVLMWNNPLNTWGKESLTQSDVQQYHADSDASSIGGGYSARQWDDQNPGLYERLYHNHQAFQLAGNKIDHQLAVPLNQKTPKKELSSEEIANKVLPSVVGVVVFDHPQSSKKQQDNNENSDTIYGEGSGIIMDQEGYIITNAHVVQKEKNASEKQSTPYRIMIYFSNGTHSTATLVGADRNTDLALLKVEADTLQPAEFGDSSKLKIGEKAIAIGNPTGRMLSGSVTQGVISGVNRFLQEQGGASKMEYIQTDAAINPGNSGGALVNKYGEIIGINSTKIAAPEYEGIGFAIPIHTAIPILKILREHGYVAGPPKIGISFQTISENFAKITGIYAGMRVVEIQDDTDAYRQGMRVGDIIVSIQDMKAYETQKVLDFIGSKKSGDVLKIVIMRTEQDEQQMKELFVMLQEDESNRLLP